jgi:hypothetical protein
MAREVPSDDAVQAAIIHVTVHPSERQRLRPAAPAQAGSCCSCCCCCCLHSVGSLVGSIIGSRPVMPPAEGTPIKGVTAVGVFWWTTLILVLGVSVFVALLIGSENDSQYLLGWFIGLFVSLMALPIVQLVAAGTAATFSVSSKRPDYVRQLRQAGKIALGVLIGSLAGGLALAIVLFAVCAPMMR